MRRMLRRVQTMIDASEERQRQELALQFMQCAATWTCSGTPDLSDQPELRQPAGPDRARPKQANQEMMNLLRRVSLTQPNPVSREQVSYDRHVRSSSIAFTHRRARAPGRSAQTPAPPAAPDAAGRRADRSQQLRRQIYIDGRRPGASRGSSARKDSIARFARSMPEMMALSGEPQARGVYLEGYGVFFDVGVPVLNQSMIVELGPMLGRTTAWSASA